MPNKTLSVILGGGRGTRLAPLTSKRCKPAVPLAGKYRLIDIPISNSINSGIFQIYVLTQFNSVSLNRHVGRTYQFDSFTRGFVEILAAEQTEQSSDWFQGTADAVRKHLQRFFTQRVDRILILSGDQIYRMDFTRFIAHHESQQAQVTIAVIPVTRERAGEFGILQVDHSGRIIRFAEKPKDPEQLDELRASSEAMARLGFSDPSRCYLASMGLYLFEPKILQAALVDQSRIDFGRDVIPCLLDQCRVSAFVFDGYWEDVGTIRSFYEANLALCEPDPLFRFYTPDAPIFTRPRFLPASRLSRCRIEQSIVSDGCLLEQAQIVRSVVGLRTRIGTGCTIRNTVIMGADFYEAQEECRSLRQGGKMCIGIGDGCHIENAIIDKNARIGSNVRLVNAGGVDRADGENWVIREGVIVVPKNAVLEDGVTI